MVSVSDFPRSFREPDTLVLLSGSDRWLRSCRRERALAGDPTTKQAVSMLCLFPTFPCFFILWESLPEKSQVEQEILLQGNWRWLKELLCFVCFHGKYFGALLHAWKGTPYSTGVQRSQQSAPIGTDSEPFDLLRSSFPWGDTEN